LDVIFYRGLAHHLKGRHASIPFHFFAPHPASNPNIATMANGEPGRIHAMRSYRTTQDRNKFFDERGRETDMLKATVNSLIVVKAKVGKTGSAPKR